jgi:hypothetical protein
MTTPTLSFLNGGAGIALISKTDLPHVLGMVPRLRRNGHTQRFVCHALPLAANRSCGIITDAGIKGHTEILVEVHFGRPAAVGFQTH